MSPKPYEVVILRPDQVRFRRQGDTLSLTLADGTHYPRVILRSCFPVSEERLYISVRDATTEEQEEIGLIQDWAALDEENRQALAAELNLHYFVPQIQRVKSIREEFGFLYWSVETDKGPKEFVMRNSIVHYARQVGPERWLLIDVNQARYEIPQVSALDGPSQKLVKRFLYL
jgi:hypothetical protein